MVPVKLHRPVRAVLLCAVLGAAAPRFAVGASLEAELGRNETRVLSASVPIVSGQSVIDLALPKRLDRLGYVRVRGRPKAPDEYFHGNEVFWIYRRACRNDGRDHEAELFGLALERGNGRVIGLKRDGEAPRSIDREGDVWLEPEVLAEDLRGDRADRTRIALDELDETTWRCVLAAEDARFFEHSGIDPRSLARAALRNLRKGRVVEGGSTITQQLVKNRDLSPERSFGRKASEAMRALALEAEHDKKEILEAYLNTVYMGHVDGLAIHGIGTAALAYFSKPAADLSLAQAAALAAMIQGPNRLSPLDDIEALRVRRDWVLSRMEELEWATPPAVARAKAEEPGGRPAALRSSAPRHFLSWVAQQVEREARKRAEAGRGFLVETTLDPWLQHLAEEAVSSRLAALRREHPHLVEAKLAAALVALDARSGAVLAYVGGDPRERSPGIDRARTAKRQPGSVVKPFVVLEALDDCGGREPLTASSRISDEPLRIDLPSGPWEPENFDHRFLGPILLRDAIAESRNVPAVRIARHCGLESTAGLFERAGLDLPTSPPPSFVLGSIESSPLALARAYTVFATPGRLLDAFASTRVETSDGRDISRTRPSARKVANPAAAFIVRDLLRTAVEEGTATTGGIEGVNVAAKTGTSSQLRDAWFAGHAGSVVAAVWVGLDDGGRLGLTGSVAAGPLWSDFMRNAVRARPTFQVERPGEVVERWVDTTTGLLVREGRSDARPELYRKGTLPARKRWWRIDAPMPAIE